jgi:predicted DNA-binding transcriptional regulator YafY
MAKKIEELLPDMIRSISKGASVSSVDIEQKHGISASSVRAHLRSLQENFYKNYYRYDGSSKKWVATELGFVDKMLLKPEEAVILNSILRNKSKLGPSLVPWNEKLVNQYVKRASSFIFKQHNTEEIDEDMEQAFATIHNTIDTKQKLKFKYSDYYRVVYPYKIINIEYYWYLLGYEESSEKEDSEIQIVKSYTMSKIRDITILDETFQYDFGNLDKKMKHILNTFFRPKNALIPVTLLIKKEFINYIDRAPFFSAWKTEGIQENIKDEVYIKYTTGVTEPEFREIIPTILKYIPNILVEEPLELQDAITNKIAQYQDLYK